MKTKGNSKKSMCLYKSLVIIRINSLLSSKNCKNTAIELCSHWLAWQRGNNSDFMWNKTKKHRRKLLVYTSQQVIGISLWHIFIITIHCTSLNEINNDNELQLHRNQVLIFHVSSYILSEIKFTMIRVILTVITHTLLWLWVECEDLSPSSSSPEFLPSWSLSSSGAPYDTRPKPLTVTEQDIIFIASH